MPAFTRRAARIVEHRWFGRAVMTTILVNAVLLGLETDLAFATRHAEPLAWAHHALVALFAIELSIRMAAHGPRAFFRDAWSCFDLVILLASLVPAIGPTASVARLGRVLRVVRVVSVNPKLRVIVATMANSIPSLAHVAMLLGLLLFVYAVIGIHAFRDADPAHWGGLGRALLTLFQIITLEGWVELQHASMATQPWAWVYYGSFVFIAVFVVVNLFIAVVLSNLEQARREVGDSAGEPTLAHVMEQLRALHDEVRELRAGGYSSRCTESGENAGEQTAMYSAPSGPGVE